MLVLGFDTAMPACSVALCQDGASLAGRSEAMAQGHAEHLMGMINDVMEEAGKGFQDLDLLAVTTGPGSFTGLRIGLAAARGLALAGGLPCLGITTFDAVAAGVSESEREAATLLVAIESKRDDLYVQAFSAGLEPLSEPQAVLPAALADAVAGLSIAGGRIVIAGDGAGRAVTALNGAGLDVALTTASETPDAGTLAALAASRWPPKTPGERLRPLYLRSPDATVPKHGGRIRP